MANTADVAKEFMKESAFTQEELDGLERTRCMPITFNGDCPEVTPEQVMKFWRVNPVRRTAN